MFDEAEQFYKALIEKLGEDNTTEYIRLTELLLKAYKEIAEETPAPPDSAFAKMVESQQTLK